MILRAARDPKPAKVHTASLRAERVPPVTAPRIPTVVTFAAAAVTVSGGASLLGWALDVPVLKGIVPGTVPPRPITALCFLLLGLALWLCTQKSSRAGRWVVTAAVSIVGGIAVLTLAEYIGAHTLFVDRLLFPDAVSAAGPPRPDGRMALNTANAFTLLAIAVLGLLHGKRLLVAAAQVLAVCAGLLGVITLVGYLYGVPGPGWISGPSAMAPQTAIVTILAAGATFLLRPHEAIAGVVTGSGVSRLIGRRMLLAALVVPPILGWLRLLGEDLGMYGERAGVTLLVLSQVVILAVVVFVTTATASRMEATAAAARRTTEQVRADWMVEHRALQLFQESMLPSGLPTMAGAEVAASYVAAADRLDIGGDWYDAFRLPSGEILLSVGDVVGHDQEAAAIMGPVRAALRAYAVEDPDPARSLTRLNRFIAADYPGGILITSVAAVYDPRTRWLSWANAGHPTPLLVTAPAEVTTLSDHGLPLGVAGGTTYETRSLVIPPRAGLILYTDGLLERRSSTAAADHDRLVRVVSAAFTKVVDVEGESGSPAERMVQQIASEMLGQSPIEDDVCLLALWTLADLDPGDDDG